MTDVAPEALEKHEHTQLVVQIQTIVQNRVRETTTCLEVNIKKTNERNKQKYTTPLQIHPPSHSFCTDPL